MKQALVNLMVLVLLLMPAACCGGTETASPQQPTATPTAAGDEFAIPADFTRYDEPSGLFSISYPPDWEVDLAVLEEGETIAKEYIEDIQSDIDLEGLQFLFMAGVDIGLGYEPSVIAGVEPKNDLLTSIEAVVAAEVASLKMATDDYAEISREFTVIDGRGAGILEFTASFTGIDAHDLQMYTIAGKTIWVVSCNSLVSGGDYTQYEDDFHAIIRSLRIHD